jgi:FixJ family two-component response regulator
MSAKRRRPLIAVVDDDVSVCRALKRLVRTHGINADTFTSGVDFLQMIETTPAFEPQCVILDVHMPGLDGFQVRTQLGTLRPHIPIIFLTAVAVPSKHAQRLTRGAVALFSKPFDEDLDLFVRTLRAILGMRTSES